jgi:ATP-dependent Clp protease ATP-binding subunit ClpC
MTMLNGYSNVTERLKRVVVLAESIARHHGHDGLDPVHLTMGLIDEGEGVAVTVLKYHGFSLATLRESAASLLPLASMDRRAPVKLDLTPEGRAALDAAQAEAKAFGHPYLGTEHLLLGLLSATRAPLAQLFGAEGFDLSEARARVRWILESAPRPYISTLNSREDR